MSTNEVTLKAHTAVAARREAKDRFPQGGVLKGYVTINEQTPQDGDEACVLITAVRERGNKAPVASAVRARSPRATRFTFEPTVRADCIKAHVSPEDGRPFISTHDESVLATGTYHTPAILTRGGVTYAVFSEYFAGMFPAGKLLRVEEVKP